MYMKATLFHDNSTAQQILHATTPFDAKRLGRQVKPFDAKMWDEQCENVVLRACLMKFHQNSELRNFLLSLGDSIIAEASPHDRIWGIGLAPTNPQAKNPATWKGRNLLGKVLMRTRAALRAIDASASRVEEEDQDEYVLVGAGAAAASSTSSGAKSSGTSHTKTDSLSLQADVATAHSLGVISQTQRSAMLEVVVGDLLDLDCSGVQYIAHQCNCKTRKYKGLASTIYKKHPKAEPYSSGALIPHGGQPQPGLVLVSGPVINMFAQYNPGPARPEAASQSGGASRSSEPEDTATNRLSWFQKCLDTVFENKDIKSVALPMKIGCGLAGGAWIQYEQLLAKFAADMASDGRRRVVIVRQAQWW
jgi:ribA/ribD-fused uncharacterized protein